ncbi:hypothetical protein CFC35_21385 [Streptomyces sp. FBKL.4005]|uniref:Uncharacterized protein n=1 Tax=Streptomyces bangladeshensis TaxID=295352 RepID=A0ABN3B8R2_9ACTN|nr:hypothetical protein CFC35_21385 [Streptomyces sp. FBKL.4005]BCM67828.1 hypothetical protein EASAB2608_03162 [Streptomyces sp. EAS-AB2608]
MGQRALRSILVATFSAVVALGVLSGHSGAKGDVRADTRWPAVAVTSAPTETADSSGELM